MRTGSIRNVHIFISSGCMLFGISLIFGICGTTDLYEISSFLSVNMFNTTSLLISVLLILVGFSSKILSIPSYFTMPDIYESAPLPVSAAVSSIVFVSGLNSLLYKT